MTSTNNKITEDTSKMKCSICKQEGHNKRSCSTPVSAPKIEAETDVKVKPPVKVEMTSQSNGLSKRLTKIVEDGRRLNDDSCTSEGTLSEALCEIKPYIEEKCRSIGATLEHKKSITLLS